jgi:ABC-type Fe3+/spermidine/putrescine transport system ATPase subunit
MSLECQGLRVRGPGFQITADDFSVAAGEWLEISAPSGFGKSTLLRSLMGLAPLEGEIRISGLDFSTRPLHQRRFGVVFQEQALFSHLSALDNALFGLRIRGRVSDADQARAEESFRTLGLLHRIHAPIEELSGGERQRLALIRAVLFGPVLLLLDEPFKGLDAQHLRLVMDYLQAFLSVSPVPVVWVSHQNGTGVPGKRLVGGDRNGQRHFQFHHS